VIQRKLGVVLLEIPTNGKDGDGLALPPPTALIPALTHLV